MRRNLGCLAASLAGACALLGRVQGARVPSVALRNAAWPGVRMPVTGLGVGAYGVPNGTNGEYWDDSVAFVAVGRWFDAGGRRVDTSLKWYHDLGGVGKALAGTTVSRKDIFITCKVDDPYGYNTTMDHFRTLLKTLGSPYCDLLLIHWPGPTYFLGHKHNVSYCHTHGPECRRETWRALTDIYHSGKARAIGVANFEKRHLEDIMQPGALVPAVNQLEFHPYWHEDDLLEYCHDKGILVDGYAPLGAPDFMAWHPEKWPTLIPDQPNVLAVAKAHNRTAAQVLQMWSFQKGVVINPRTNKPAHMKENLAVFDPPTTFSLTDAEMQSIENVPVPKQNKVCPDPHLVP